MQHSPYDKQSRLIYIQTTDASETKIYAWAEITYHQPDKHHLDGITIKTSDNRELHYGINSHAKYKGRRYLLTDVTSPELPKETYDYWDSHEGFLLGGRKWPDNRYRQACYYAKEDNPLPIG